MSLCLHKGWSKAIVRDAGLPTPRSVLIERIEDLAMGGCANGRTHVGPTRIADLRYPLFAKPVAEGTGKGVTPASRIATPEQLTLECDRLLDRYQQPVLVEEFLPGREFTVGVLGTGLQATALGTLEIVLLDVAEPGVYSYVNKERCEELVEYRLVRGAEDEPVRQAEQLAVAAWRALGGRDAGRIDLRCDAEGRPQFIEANPLAGLHPAHSDLPMVATAVGLRYVELIERIIASASARDSAHYPVKATA
jgi:D-alanine-D-alanine ligase